MGKENVFYRINKLAKESPVTGAFPANYEAAFDLPADLRNKNILDVCSGISSFSEWVFQHGGSPQAVDINYADFETLTNSYRDTFLKVMQQEPNPNPETYKKRYKERIFPFALSLNVHPSIYIAASATHLPFRNNSYDYVVSLNGLFGTLDTDPNILNLAITEAIRVVKKGGIIQIAPAGQYPTLSPQEMKNQNNVIAELQKNPRLKVSYVRKRYNDRIMGILTITKKK